MQPPICIACEPPLGQVSTVSEGKYAEFFVSLSFHGAPLSARNRLIEVVLWHDGHINGEWGEKVLEKVVLPHGRYDGTVEFFSGSLAKPTKAQTIRFTLKFKLDDSDWQWMNDIDPLGNGELLFQSSERPNCLSDYIQYLDPICQCQPLTVASDHDPLNIWLLSTEVPAAQDKQSTWKHTHLGLPKDISRWFALVRHSTPWLGPRQGDKFFAPDKGAILASFLCMDGIHLVLLAINGIPDLTTTIGNDCQGHVVVTGRNDGLASAQMQVLVASGTSFEVANNAIMHQARILICPQHIESGQHNYEEPLNQWYDSFSYCTWNGLGQELNEDKIHNALESLLKNNIDVSTLIIDDNWQSLDFEGSSNFDFRWTRFEANQENFPHGLKQTISRLRREHSYIKHIAVWHGAFGYWGGISPYSDLAKDYKIQDVKKQDHEPYLSNGYFSTVAAQDVHRFYDDFYGFLASCGVDSVKADVQFLPDYLADAADRRDMIYAYQDAWVAASQKHFEGRVISCMSQTPQILFHSLLLPDKPRYIARNSDDFFPNPPSSHTWHIFCNAHNALLTQHLHLIPDWDMFQTAHEFASMHAAARCLSGGPIYITDVPGKHDLNIIRSMTAKTIDGRTTILRPELAGITMEQYVKPQSSRFLRIGTVHQGASMLGIFNIGDRSRAELVKLSSFRGIVSGKRYVVCKHLTDEIFESFSDGDVLPATLVELEPMHHEILTACPISTYRDTEIAVLGLLGKLSGAAAVKSVDYTMNSGDGVIKLLISMKAVGRLGLYLPNAQKYLCQGSIHAILWVNGSSIPIDNPKARDCILELDTECACSMITSKGAKSHALIEITIRVP